MKIDDGPLNRYLIKNLQPLTEADPSLLANYVAALLKNNKPKKELQKLCIDQLYDFLGEGTKPFVAKLFQSLEDGTVPLSSEEMETGKAIESGSAIGSGVDAVEVATSPPHLERIPSTALRSFSDEGEEESSDDEDDDRNHKHRRRVSRSRSFDRDGEDEADRGIYRKRGRGVDNGPLLRENDHHGNERRGTGHPSQNERDQLGKFERRFGRDHGSGRFSGDGAQRGGMRSAAQFRDGGPRFDGANGVIRGNLGRGRGVGSAWPPHDQRFPPPPFPDGPEFAPPLLPPGPGAGFFPGRGLPGRGAHTPWPGYGPLPAIGNGPLEHSHALSGGIPGGRGPPISAGMGLGINIGIGRPRCLDFEERGYCLRGDLCPMEHGANRIVVEDVQSLSKFNLSLSLPSGRGLSVGPVSGAPPSGAIVPSGLGLVSRNNHGSREASLPAVGENALLVNDAGAEPDSYDPDQPLWNKERTEASPGIRSLPSFQKGSNEQGWEGDSADRRDTAEVSEGMETGRLVRSGGNTNGGFQTPEGGPSVWDRIGPAVGVGSRSDAGSHSSMPTVDIHHAGKLLRKDIGEDANPRPRGAWQGKWNREVDSEEDGIRRGSSGTFVAHGRGRGSGRGDAAASSQRSGEGTSYGSRATGGRNSNALGTERAQRTLYVSFIPLSNNKTEQLLAHFQKFGEILDIRIPVHSDRAFVQFSRREDAESALTAPDAVMGNRFIRLSWANRDSILDHVDPAAAAVRSLKAGSGLSTGSLGQVLHVPEKAYMNGSGSAQVEPGLNDLAGKSVSASANGLSPTPVPTGSAVKKQEELERMKEELRLKQEALAQKRNDFRRKLNSLAKQGPAQGETLESEQPSKRRRFDDAEENTPVSEKAIISPYIPNLLAASAPTEPLPAAALVKSTSGDALTKQAVSVVPVQPPQPSPRTGRPSHSLRVNSPNVIYMPWGPARFKLDNRTTIFRVLPPFPAAVTDVGALKDHFMAFGELANVEIEDSADGQKVEGNTNLSGTTSVRVNFATRRAAERAFVQGKWLQGQNLQLVWVNSTAITPGGGGAAATWERPSLATAKQGAGLPSSAEQEGINGNGDGGREVVGHRQEVEIKVTDENRSGDNDIETGGTEKKVPTTVQKVEGENDSEMSAHVFSKSESNVVTPEPLTINAPEEALASNSTGFSN